MLGLGNTLSGGIVPAAATAFSNTYSIDFDGSDDFAVTGDSREWNGAGSWSWWQKDTVTDGNTIPFANSDTSFYIQIYQQRWIVVNKYFSQTTQNSFYASSSEIGDGNWHHVVLTMDGVPSSNTYKLYLDGALIDTHARTHGTADDLADGILYIGKYSSGLLYDGQLDEIGVWLGDILSLAEVQALYNSGVPIDLQTDAGDYASSGSLTSYWKMGDGDTFPTLTDSEGGSDATMTNMIAGDIVSDVPS